MAERPALIFDGACGVCSSVARWTRRRLPRSVAVVPYQRADLEAYGITEEAAREKVQWVAADGAVEEGAPAAARALQAIGGLWAFLGRASDTPVLRPVSAAVYELVSRNRHRIPSGKPVCR